MKNEQTVLFKKELVRRVPHFPLKHDKRENNKWAIQFFQNGLYRIIYWGQNPQFKV